MECRPGGFVGNVIIQNAREAFGLVKYYDLRQAGIEVAVDKGKCIVRKVMEETPFGRSEIRESDKILALGGIDVNDPDVLRRMLRALYVTGQELVVLTVDRPEKGLTKVKVRLSQ